MKDKEIKKGEIILYKSPQGPEIEVKLEQDSVWLDAHLIAKLFNVNRPAIVKHINNIYKTGELDKKSTCSILEQVAADGKARKMNLYNLDMIISVGYRVNSRRATQFRIWATKTLKEHLIKGYTINEKQLLQAKSRLKELQSMISFLEQKSKEKILAGQEQELLNLLSAYSKTLILLEQYDLGKLNLTRKAKGEYELQFEEAAKVVEQIKKQLTAKKEAGAFFGQDNDNKLRAILGNI